MNILFCGPYFSELAIREKSAISQAGVRWTLGLVNALRGLGHHVTMITHCTEQMWPKSSIVWQDSNPKWFYGADCRCIGYPNVPFLRTLWLNMRYAAEVRRACRETHYDVLLCYNTFVPWHVAAMRAARKLGVKCCPIILDGDDPRKDGWRKMMRDNRFADGVIFLSHWLASHYPMGMPQGGRMPVFQMDGGSDGFNGHRPSESGEEHLFTVAHTGSLNPQRELAFIAKMLKSYKDPNTRFVFTGKIDRDVVMRMVDNDSRVEVRGLVSPEELNRICQDVDVFISARIPDHCDNVVNFPSKLPNYLSWGRPVVATWVDSLSPDYRKFLFVPVDNTPEGMAQKLNDVRGLSLSQRENIYQAIADWFGMSKTWKAQSLRLLEWISSLLAVVVTVCVIFDLPRRGITKLIYG